MRFHKQLDTEGVTVTEWVALRTLLSQGETSHVALIQALGMTKGAASKVISRLEEKGLVQRQMAEGSARKQRLVLTRKGKVLVPKLAELADENDAYFFAHLSAKERKALMGAMQALVSHHQLKQIPTA
jgi:DNA-binding MarR family transcriptional regulator